MIEKERERERKIACGEAKGRTSVTAVHIGGCMYGGEKEYERVR